MKNKKLDNAIAFINNELELYYEGKRIVKLFQVSNSNYLLIYQTPNNEYQFAQGDDTKAMRGYLEALANIIAMGGEFGLTQVENLMLNSKRYLVS
jgi:hypothetical protein